MRTSVAKIDAEKVEIEKPMTTKATEKPSSRAWIVWAMAAIFYMYEYILRASPSVMTQALMQDFAITTTSLGILSSMYYYAYTPLQIPCGLIVDRLGARVVITMSSALCVVGAFLFAKGTTFGMAELGRFLMGAGSACAFLSTLKLVSDWFPPKYFAVLSGMTTMMGITTGGYLVGRPFAFFVSNVGWRQAMLWSVIVGIVVTFLCWLIIRNSPKKADATHKGKTSTSTIIKDMKILVRNRQTWLVALYGCLFYVPVSVFSELWAVPYLMQKYGIDNAAAASISVSLILGKGVGAPSVAMISNYLNSRKVVMYWGAFIASCAFLTSIYLPVPMWMMEVLLFIAGTCAGAQVLCFAVNQETNPHEISATTVGFTNTIVMLSGIIFQPFLGAILDWVWDGKLGEQGMRVYSLDAYQTAMLALPICLFLSWIIVFFIKETYPQEAKS